LFNFSLARSWFHTGISSLKIIKTQKNHVNKALFMTHFRRQNSHSPNLKKPFGYIMTNYGKGEMLVEYLYKITLK